MAAVSVTELSCDACLPYLRCGAIPPYIRKSYYVVTMEMGDVMFEQTPTKLVALEPRRVVCKSHEGQAIER